jgi:hypothetical protein
MIRPALHVVQMRRGIFFRARRNRNSPYLGHERKLTSATPGAKQSCENRFAT